MVPSPPGQARVAEGMAISLRALQRWWRQFVGDGAGGHRRKGSMRHVAHRLSQKERQQILAVCNEPEYASLPPAQIVPALVSSDIRFWSSGDTKTGPPDGLLTGGLRRPLDRCFIGGCRVVVVGGGICAA